MRSSSVRKRGCDPPPVPEWRRDRDVFPAVAKLIITTPPFCGIRFKTSSGTFRGCPEKECIEEWNGEDGRSRLSNSEVKQNKNTDSIETAVQRGFINYPYFAQHAPFLAGIRDDARFKQILGQVRVLWERFEA